MDAWELRAHRMVKIGKIARRLRIAGRVQGVGFRAALCAAAEDRGLSGWVRNRSDGCVEAELHGAIEDVEALIGWSQHGPTAARVTEVRVERVELVDATPSPTARVVQRPTA